MNRLIMSLCSALVALPAGVAAGQTPPLKMEVGASRTLAADGPVRRLEISTAGIVRAAAPGAREIRLTGESSGATEVTVVTALGRRTYAVEVAERGAAEAEALRRGLADRPGLSAIAVDKPGETYVLSGEVQSLEAQGRAEALANAAAGAPVINQAEVAGGQVVAVDVRFIAISDSTLKSLGFNFSKLGQGIEWAVFSPNTLTSFSNSRDGLELQATQPFQSAFNLLLHNRNEGVVGALSALSEAGLSHVLAQPTLMARSGEQAEFLAGGDVPIPVPQAGGANGAITVEYRPYGVRLSVEPYVLSNKRIVLKLAPEVSELDYTNAVQVQGFRIPGFRRRSASTTVELGDGQSFIIAGLTYAASSANDAKTPGLGELPVLGALFKTAQRSREKLELIIVATPRLVAPMEAGEIADLATPPQPAPSIVEILSGANGVERRAARVGLSR